MANHLARHDTNGHLLKHPTSKHLANECPTASSCRDLTCPTSDSAVVTASGPNANCTCVADTYSLSKVGWFWSGLAGWCASASTDFTLQIECRAGGDWKIDIISVVGGYTYFTGTATLSDITCTGGAFTGSATINGVDNSGSGGPDCSGCTATITF